MLSNCLLPFFFAGVKTALPVRVKKTLIGVRQTYLWQEFGEAVLEYLEHVLGGVNPAPLRRTCPRFLSPDEIKFALHKACPDFYGKAATH
jgi:hypothetical protein